jgi:hypothetical protein
MVATMITTMIERQPNWMLHRAAKGTGTLKPQGFAL